MSQAKTVKAKLTIYPCGCRNELHEPTGALRNVHRCQQHARDAQVPETLGEHYYAHFGLLDRGMLQPTAHVPELVEALGDVPAPGDNKDVLEIGCGVSPYAAMLIGRGWNYTGIDPSRWACGWMRRMYSVDMIPVRFDAVDPPELHGPYGMILSTHALEHMDDAPRALARCAELLAPGGQLWLVVPDGTDKVNPDHNWFFSQDSLWFAVESTGLTVETITIRRYVQRENFLYLRASKAKAEVAVIKEETLSPEVETVAPKAEVVSEDESHGIDTKQSARPPV